MVNYGNLLKGPDKMDFEKKIKRSRKGKRRWLFYLFVAALVFFSAAAGLVVPLASKFALLEVFFMLTPSSGFISETNVLILGADEAGGVHRSDTIMVAHINPLDKETKLLSIPRDTLVVIPGRGLDKINHAFAFGGVELAASTISGFLKIDIPYYIEINVDGLAHIIDKLGGIVIDVEKRMYYVDYAQGLFVDLKPGPQRLNGREAVGYVRFRHDNEGDIGRIRRQQKFLSALASELTSKSNILRSPGLLLSLFSEINTNLNFKEILGLAMAVRQSYDLGRIEMASLPGKELTIDNVYYLRPDYEATQSIVDKFFRSEKKKAARSSSLNTSYLFN